MEFKTIAEIKDTCSEEYQKELRKAKRNCPPGVLRSRGRYLSYINPENQEVVKDEWKGTLKHIKAFIEEAKKAKADDVMIEGGLDWAASVRDWNVDYDPWVGEWSVLVWKNESLLQKTKNKV